MKDTVSFQDSIALRYFIGIASVLFAGQLIFSIVILHANFTQQRRDLHTRATTHVNFLSEVIQDDILTNNFYPLETLMQQTASEEDFIYSIILNADDSPVTNFLSGNDPLIRAAVENADEPNTLSRINYILQERQVVEVESPIIADNILIGTVRLGYSVENSLSRLQNNIVTTVIWSIMLSFLLMTITIVIFNIQIRSPLHKLSLIAKQFAQGNLEVRSSATGNTEISQLQNAFNEMAGEIQDNIVEMNKLSQVASRTKNAVIICDSLGRIEWVNQAFETITGYSFDEVNGKTPGSLLQGEKSDPEIIKSMREHLLLGEGFNVEIINYHKLGREYWIAIEVRPVRDDNDMVTNFIAIETDITQRKESEITILKALEKERELGELKSRFVSMVSHEFRTPLTTMLTTASFLEEAEGQISSEKRLARLQKIQIAAHEMAKLLNDILLLGKADANRLDYQPRPVDFMAFCTELIEDILEFSRKSHHISIINRMLDSTVILDEKLMRQIITNLITNAIKYSPEGSKITLVLTYEKLILTIQICDEGIGIPEQDQPHLFEPFHRAKNVQDIPGTGLGLAITKKAVELHNGEITFECTQKQGTCFTIRIPQPNF